MRAGKTMGNRRGSEGRDPQFGVSFHDWEALEPSANFETSVWRRIRASAVEPRRIAVLSFLDPWILPHPAWMAALVTVAVWIGFSTGTSTWTGSGHPPAWEPLLGSRTLAGSFLAVSAGGRP